MKRRGYAPAMFIRRAAIASIAPCFYRILYSDPCVFLLHSSLDTLKPARGNPVPFSSRNITMVSRTFNFLCSTAFSYLRSTQCGAFHSPVSDESSCTSFSPLELVPTSIIKKLRSVNKS
ncbi:hypothetical protein KP509_30G020100 [Ceratopteris richardii]|uniref:Uncharacterized protein n=1 Tax=Ceratopteris richardii TaxID=49495 RepID=A0A8T2R1A0_CERRI|nr:hypothetical protein KP509_30G020100 [Ceratopteris richardii]